MTRYAPRFFEEFEPGETFHTAQYSFSESSIIDYAFTWDPQPFHLDKQYAEDSVYGGLIASGFQTLGVTFRLMFQAGMFGKNRGGRGIENLRWPRPVRPGDTIRVEVKVADCIPARTTGQVVVDATAFNQSDEDVLSARFINIIPKRPADSALA
jgi:acyl dehydratase